MQRSAFIAKNIQRMNGRDSRRYFLRMKIYGEYFFLRLIQERIAQHKSIARFAARAFDAAIRLIEFFRGEREMRELHIQANLLKTRTQVSGLRMTRAAPSSLNLSQHFETWPRCR